MSHRLTIDSAVLARVNRALEDVRAGKMIILVDDEDRENEGDLCMAAELVTPDAINFMARYGRGLICLALDEDQVERLDLPMMSVPGRRGPRLGTAFTVSIEAAEGVTTGISAADRAHTIRVAINPNARPGDLVTPGHVFPLKARPGGVLVRTGQTEGGVDLARLAGLRPCGVICEIMKDDGTMARMPDLEVFAEEHGLQILSIADMIQYRLQTEVMVRCVGRRPMRLDQTGTEWVAAAYQVDVENRHALALVKGQVTTEDPVLCRVHSGSIIADLFSSTHSEGGANLRQAIERIEQAGQGVVLYLPSQRSVAEEFSSWEGTDSVPKAADSVTSLSDAELKSRGQSKQILRKFGLGAQMLLDLGVRKLRLLSNSERKIAGLTGYGIEVVERVPLGPSGNHTPNED
ncbi:MAG: 3,4-dihydroxy-2-butanone-4-phosphate synthase [Deltaproteobacteria bacterium]|jgi:3,4-dihydroxy 2-butanone 4-phosphate synthase/GTP cyclohydrolase II|nr:3,4-dihydroxy-2-butanone-4-phosphate synthase [Deltaproteobacteria bacterium]MBW2529991.1 3,4-dihydroxy-2-butanone-4-phosphate synthase [Deltaproteobacteria bacterium]